MLEPYQGTTFNLKGLPGFSLEFVIADGVVTDVKISQPNGTFSGKKKRVAELQA